MVNGFNVVDRLLVILRFVMIIENLFCDMIVSLIFDEVL